MKNDAMVPGPSSPTGLSRMAIWYPVGLLAVVNAFNYMDRMVLPVLLPDIKADLNLSDTQLGLLTGFAFALFYAAFGIPIARWADRGVRRNIISLALAVWSVMTALSGAAQNFVQLLLARIGVGSGEAGCIPPSLSLISDVVPMESRSGAIAIHATGATIGSFVALALGGWLAGEIGWRWTFVVFGAPGLVLALIVRTTLREPQRGLADGITEAQAPLPLGAAFRYMAQNRALRHLIAVFAFGSFAAFGLNQWMPSFFVRSFDITMAEVGAWFGVAYGLGSGIGTFSGGFIANALVRRDSRWGVWIGAICYSVAVPVGFVIFSTGSVDVAFAFAFVFFVIVGVPNGPMFAMVQAVSLQRIRATAAATNMFAASVIGIGGGPFVVGVLSDAFAASAGSDSLRNALTVALVLLLWPVVHCLFAARTLREDIETAQSGGGLSGY